MKLHRFRIKQKSDIYKVEHGATVGGIYVCVFCSLKMTISGENNKKKNLTVMMKTAAEFDT